MGWNYSYDKFGENSHRVTYAQSTVDPTLNRSYDYDQVGRLWEEHSGNEADAHVASPQQPFPSTPTGPISHSYRYDQHGNMTYRVGWGGTFSSYTNQYRTFTNNRQDGIYYDAAGNLTNDGALYTYDATGQQVSGVYPPGWGGYANYSLYQAYDGNRLRGAKADNGVLTYALRSSVLGSQVVAELSSVNNSWVWTRGYVYLGGQLLAIQWDGVLWVHQDPVVKSQRLTNSAGSISASLELDAWGGETSRSWNSFQQPRKFTTYERDGSGNDQAMLRQYHNYWMRFDQPDRYGGSYEASDPQSFNRYAYVNNDPVNFVDPSGLLRIQQCTVDWIMFFGEKIYGKPYNCRTIADDSEFIGGGGISIDKAVEDAKNAITDSTTCQKLFKDFKGALEKLDEFKKKGDIRVEDKGIFSLRDNQTKTMTERGLTGAFYEGKIYLNPNSADINQDYDDFSKKFPLALFGSQLKGASSSQMLTAIVIHELLHATGDLAPDTDAQSMWNTVNVYLACLKNPPKK